VILDYVRYVQRRRAEGQPRWLGIGAESPSHSPASFPRVTILIPTRDRVDLLEKCVRSILDLTAYPNFEIVILDNDSDKPETKKFFDLITESHVRVVTTPGAFNYSKIMNAGVRVTNGDLICSLNNDTQVLNPEWLTDMVYHLSESSAGIVGALLTFKGGDIQHAGIALGYTGVAGHVFAGESIGGSSNQWNIAENCYPVSAVTFACALTSRDTWAALNGLDETLKVGLNDVDYCLRLKALGFDSIVCTHAKLIHHESQSRKPMKSIQGMFRAAIDVTRFSRKHRALLVEDPFFRLESSSA
jgi:GT2 family glycosyltransferase